MAAVKAGLHDRGGLGAAEQGLDDNAVGQPIARGHRATTRVTLGNHRSGIGRHAAIAPIARNFVGQRGVQRKTPPRQRIERAAGAPVERQEAAGLAGCRSGDLGPFDDDDVDAPATEEVGGTRADHTGTTDHDAHASPHCRMLHRRLVWLDTGSHVRSG